MSRRDDIGPYGRALEIAAGEGRCLMCGRMVLDAKVTRDPENHPHAFVVTTHCRTHSLTGFTHPTISDFGRMARVSGQLLANGRSVAAVTAWWDYPGLSRGVIPGLR